MSSRQYFIGHNTLEKRTLLLDVALIKAIENISLNCQLTFSEAVVDILKKGVKQQ